MRNSPLILIVAVVFLVSCTRDAPRDNPFDPNSDIYQYAHSISGTVQRKVPPYAPVANAEVRIPSLKFYTTTDAAGHFHLGKIPTDTATVVISRDGYGNWRYSGAMNEFPETIAMNAWPQVDSLQTITTHQSHWWPVEDEYSLTVHCWYSDLDGVTDVDSVRFEIPGPGIHIPLPGLVNAAGYVFAALYDWQLDSPMTDLIGEPVFVQVRDLDSLWSVPQTTYISRFIESTPLPISPVGNQETGPYPILRWDYFNASYTFSFQVQLFRITAGNTATLILKKPDLSQNRTEYTVTDSLPNGSYYWTLGVIDRFRNSSHSKEATFTVAE